MLANPDRWGEENISTYYPKHRRPFSYDQFEQDLIADLPEKNWVDIDADTKFTKSAVGLYGSPRDGSWVEMYSEEYTDSYASAHKWRIEWCSEAAN